MAILAIVYNDTLYKNMEMNTIYEKTPHERQARQNLFI